MVDIIIPVYNVEAYVEKCLKSVQNQTYKDIHVIVVDDGSTDLSGEIVEKFSTCRNFTIIHQSNKGLSAARNTGLKVATGEFIMFIDSDDWIEPITVEALLSALKRHEADIACCRFMLEYEKYSICKCLNEGAEEEYTSEQALKELLAKKSIYYAAWGKLYKKSLFDNVMFPVGKIHEDIPVTPKVLLKCNRIITIDKAFFHYRQQENSLSRCLYNKHHHDLYEFTIANRYLSEIYPSLKEAYAASLFVACKDLICMFKTEEAKKQFKTEYLYYKAEIKNNILPILRNRCLSFKIKVSVLSVLLPLRSSIKRLFIK